MVKFILIILVSISIAHADIFDFGSDKNKENSVPSLIKKLKSLEIKDGPEFEDSFNQTVKSIEQTIEQEKLYCSGESVDSEGKTLPPAQKPLCMRELKKQYLEATEVIFEMKKKYLGFLHQKQLQNLSETQKKLKADIEKSF